MRIKQLSIKNINYIKTEYTQSLYESIKRIGLSFPLKITMKDNQYYCVDGNKRLSAIHDILKNETGYEKLNQINIIIINDGSTRSNDCWRSRNTH